MGQLIYGRQAVLAALRGPAGPLEEVLVAEGQDEGFVRQVRHLARAAGVPLKVMPRAALDRLCGRGRHQGVAARRGDFAYVSLEEMVEVVAGAGATPLLVAGDSLQDPMNLGNLCRSALAAGAQGVIIPKDRAAAVTPAVLKAAAGALESLPVARVTNLAESLIRLKAAGLWVAGLEAGADFQNLNVALLLVRRLMVRNGGKMQVLQEDDGGMTVRLQFPAGKRGEGALRESDAQDLGR